MSNYPLRTTIYLCDLTHNFAGRATADTIPLGIGCIASYLKKELADNIEVNLFKFPDDLNRALTKKMPEIIGFSNYVWNFNLACKFAERIKEVSKKTAVVFGGPNYPQERETKERFFSHFPAIDFYIKGEGEKAFSSLVKALMSNRFSVEAVNKMELKNIDFVRNGRLIEGELLPRLTSLDEIESPYLAGLFDDFLQREMMPLIQTDRGCPFSCAYCCEGGAYHCRVVRRSQEQVEAEINYIAQRSKKAHGLFIANSNFGMYPADIATAKAIAKVREQTGWPHYINVATAKENKEAVIEISRILHGALRVCASVQSTDEKVLKAIGRRNVSLATITTMARQSKQIDSNTYSEIILCLPEDSKEKHLQSIKDMIELDLNFILVYTLMLLDGSELAKESILRKYGIVTKYRVLPRCFGRYTILDRDFNIAEIEKVAVANATLPFLDYLACRVFFLALNLFYNDGIFEEVIAVLKGFGLSIFQWLEEIASLIIKTDGSPEIKRLFREFLKETKEELWSDRAELNRFIEKEGILEKYLKGELGSNLAYKYKVLALVKHSQALHEVAFRAAKILIIPKVNNGEKDLFLPFWSELKKFSIFRKADPFDVEGSRVEDFHFNFINLCHFNNLDFSMRALKENIRIRFFHSEEQKANLKKYLSLYGRDNLGISRVLSRVFIKEIFKKTEKMG